MCGGGGGSNMKYSPGIQYKYLNQFKQFIKLIKNYYMYIKFSGDEMHMHVLITFICEYIQNEYLLLYITV